MSLSIDEAPNTINISIIKKPTSILLKQVEYVKELALSNMNSINIEQNLKEIEADTTTYIDMLSNYKSPSSWIKAGWYIAQKGSLYNILDCGESILCFNCNKNFERNDIKNAKYGYVMSDKLIPNFMKRKMIRAFVICNDCINNTPFPPPKKWTDAILLSVYHNYKKQKYSIAQSIAIQKVKEKLDTTLNIDAEKLNNLTKSISNQQNEIERLQSKLEKHEQIITKKKKEFNNKIVKSTQELSKLRDTMVNKKTNNKMSNKEEPSEDDLCRVCFDDVIQNVLVPCGHYILCKDCSTIITDECPICRTKIKQTLPVFKN